MVSKEGEIFLRVHSCFICKPKPAFYPYDLCLAMADMFVDWPE